VAIAGVLLVFCYLIVPSVGGMLYSSQIGRRLAIGWIMGVVVSMLGMYLSVRLDRPTCAAIVCTFGIVPALMAVVRPLLLRRTIQHSKCKQDVCPNTRGEDAALFTPMLRIRSRLNVEFCILNYETIPPPSTNSVLPVVNGFVISMRIASATSSA
jgi:hypothetical protein